MKALFTHFVHDDQGQDLIEYALLGSFVSLAAYLGSDLLGTALNGWYDVTEDSVNKMKTAATIP